MLKTYFSNNSTQKNAQTFLAEQTQKAHASINYLPSSKLITRKIYKTFDLFAIKYKNATIKSIKTNTHFLQTYLNQMNENLSFKEFFLSKKSSQNRKKRSIRNLEKEGREFVNFWSKYPVFVYTGVYKQNLVLISSVKWNIFVKF